MFIGGITEVPIEVNEIALWIALALQDKKNDICWSCIAEEERLRVGLPISPASPNLTST